MQGAATFIAAGTHPFEVSNGLGRPAYRDPVWALEAAVAEVVEHGNVRCADEIPKEAEEIRIRHGDIVAEPEVEVRNDDGRRLDASRTVVARLSEVGRARSLLDHGRPGIRLPGLEMIEEDRLESQVQLACRHPGGQHRIGAHVGAGEGSGTVPEADPLGAVGPGEQGIQVPVLVDVTEVDIESRLGVGADGRASKPSLAVAQADPVRTPDDSEDGVGDPIPIDVSQRHSVTGEDGRLQVDAAGEATRAVPETDPIRLVRVGEDRIELAVSIDLTERQAKRALGLGAEVDAIAEAAGTITQTDLIGPTRDRHHRIQVRITIQMPESHVRGLDDSGADIRAADEPT